MNRRSIIGKRFRLYDYDHKLLVEYEIKDCHLPRAGAWIQYEPLGEGEGYLMAWGTFCDLARVGRVSGCAWWLRELGVVIGESPRARMEWEFSRVEGFAPLRKYTGAGRYAKVYPGGRRPRRT